MTEEERKQLELEFPEKICWVEGHSFDYGYCQLCGSIDQEYFTDYED
jgi:hypothetical protein